MAVDPVAARYAQALFESAKAEQAVEPTLEQLTLISGLLREYAELRQLLGNPGVEPETKVGVFDRALKGAWSELVRAFVLMVITLERADALMAIVEAFQAVVDADQGRLQAVVRSVHPLPEPVLRRLRRRLERREGKQIELTTALSPALLGGVQIQLGHRVIDSSVQRQLVELRERLQAVPVH